MAAYNVILLFLSCIVVVFIYKVFIFFLSIILKRNDIADISWGISFILVAIVVLVSGPISLELFLLATLVFAWGGRLAIRIFLRNLKKKEDSRYAKLRKEAGKNVLLVSFFKVYLLQGVLAVAVASPIIFVAINPNPVGIFDIFGVIVWIIGFYFEVVGDYQLDKFLSDPKNKGKIMQSGLWRYSRHPNYFGEVVMWWGIFLIAVSSGFVSVIGPIVITYLILKVSGVPMLEKKYTGNKEYDDYKRRTSVFVPLLPQR